MLRLGWRTVIERRGPGLKRDRTAHQHAVVLGIAVAWHGSLTVALTVAAFCVGMHKTVLAGDLLFQRHVLNDQTDYSAAALIDVNHDGKLDIVCGGDWYENPHWTKRTTTEIPRIGGRPDGFSHLEFDVNRDSWVDVITVNWRSRSIKWMQHPGASLGPWTLHTVVEPGPMESGRLVDIDGDGQLDLLPNGGNFSAWWEFRWANSDAPGDPAWIRHDLPDQANGHGMGFGDIDGDGRKDIVAQHGWLKAPEDARNGTWQWQPEFNMERASIPMLIVDVDDDGDSDIVWCSAHGFGVYWLEQSKTADEKRVWNRTAIDTSWSQGHSPLWADLDNNGRSELIIGKRYMAHGGADPGEYDPIAIYRYEFAPETRTWNRWTVSPFGQRVGIGLDPKVADIDQDGDLDLMASGRSGLYWLENLGPGDSSALTPETPIYGDHKNLLLLADAQDKLQPIHDAEAWGQRRMHINESIAFAHGKIPEPISRIPLDLVVLQSSNHKSYTQQQIQYSVDVGRRVTAVLLAPHKAVAGETAGIVCMFENHPAASIESDLALQLASQLAERGFVCLVPSIVLPKDQPPLADCVWQAMRAADVLQASELVHGERIGFVGDAFQGQLGLYLAAQDQRFTATLTDASSANELIAAKSNHYSLGEVIAAVAPRALQIVLPQNLTSQQALTQGIEQAMPVFALRSVPNRLIVSQANLLESDASPTLVWLESQFPPLAH